MRLRQCLLAVLLPAHASAQGDSDLPTWAQSLSDEIHTMFEDSLNFRKIQREYMEGQWVGERKDAQAVLAQLQTEFGDWFSELSTHLTRMHDFVQSTALAAGSGGGGMPTTYWDADGLPGNGVVGLTATGQSDVPEHWNTRFKWNVNWNQSVVKVPSDLPRNIQGAKECIQWSHALDQWWISNTPPALRDKMLYQFFGCHEGPFRLYPGREWTRSHSGTPSFYDTHVRPWYTAAQSGPKDVVIILDTSNSMSGWRFAMAKAIATNIIDSLSQDDYFSVITCGQSAANYYAIFFYRPNREVLGCSKTRLAPATPSNKLAIKKQIDALKPFLGTRFGPAFQHAFDMLRLQRQISARHNCQQVIAFITDNNEEDGGYWGGHCGSGYYDDNGAWNPPPLCDYRNYHSDMERGGVFQELTDTVFANTQTSSWDGRIFSFAIDTDNNRDRATGVACRAGGPNGYISDVRHHKDIGPTHARQFTRPYHDFVASATLNEQLAWSAPYIDATTGTLLVSLAAGVRLGTGFKGVVGLDVVVSDIVDKIQSKLWGDVYAFLLNKRGEAVVHPRNKPLHEVVGDVQFPLVEELEMIENARPAEFRDVRKAMLAGQSGQRTFSAPTFWRRGGEAEGFTVDWHLKRYTWGKIPHSDFSLCIVERVGIDHVEFARRVASLPQDAAGRQALYHRIGLLSQSALVQRGLPANQRRSNAAGRWFADGRLSYQISATCFCDVNTYMRADEMTTAEADRVDAQVYGPIVPASCSATPDKMDIKPECIHDIRAALHGAMSDSGATGWAESFQQNAGQVTSFVSQVAWRYMGTSEGSQIVFPGVQITKTMQSFTRPWYFRAVSDPRRYSVTTLYEDLFGKGQVISFTKAVMAGKDLHYHNTSGQYRGACSADTDCNLFDAATGYTDKHSTCFEGTCTSRLVAGVAAVDLKEVGWQRLVSSVVERGTYPCGQGDTRCYIVDPSSFVLYNSSASWPEPERYNSPSLGEVEGELMRQLAFVSGLFNRTDEVVFQGVCDHSSGWIEDYRDVIRRAEDWDNVGDMLRFKLGPKPPHSSKFMCVKDVSFYTLQRDVAASQTWSGQVASACATADWTATVIPRTSLLLVRLRNRYNREEQLNSANGHSAPPIRHFGCRVYNQAMRAGSVPVSNVTCAVLTTQQQPDLPTEACQPGFPNLGLCVDRGGAGALRAAVGFVCSVVALVTALLH